MKFSHDSEGFTHLGATPTMQMKEHCNVVMIILHKAKWTIVSRLARLRKGVRMCVQPGTTVIFSIAISHIVRLCDSFAIEMMDDCREYLQ